MSVDDGLAQRIRECLDPVSPAVEKKMFGGLCFMLNGHMCCGVTRDRLMLRVGPARYTDALALPGAREMDFTGRPMKGFVFIDEESVAEDAALRAALDLALAFNRELPPK